MLSYCFATAVMFIDNLSASAICTPCNKRDSPNQLEKPDSPADTFSLRQGSPDNTKETPVPAEAGRRQNKCCPYNFDSRLCQVVNDRVLCGYNRNVGKPRNDAAPIGLTGGCRIRGGRLECGYEQGPFDNIRRPPAWNNADGIDPSVGNRDDTDAEYAYYDVNHGKLLLNNKMGIKVTRRVKLTRVENSTRKLKLSKEINAVTKCIEIKERIVCK